MKDVVNIGCGVDIQSDAHNVDFRASHGVDEVCDLSKFPWPWENRRWREIRMFDFLEHFPISATRRILDECRRLLSDDGLLVVQVPDMEILGRALGALGGYPCHRCGYEWGTTDGYFTYNPCPGCSVSHVDAVEAAIGRIYGGQDYAGNFHMAGFTGISLRSILEEAGFEFLKFLEEEHQRKNWNIKAVVKKGSVWR